MCQNDYVTVGTGGYRLMRPLMLNQIYCQNSSIYQKKSEVFEHKNKEL